MEAFGRRLPLRAAGMLLRELTRHHPPSATTLESLVTHWSHDFTTRFTPRWVPLEAQTEHQTRTTLAAAIHTPHP